ncbi:MAG: transmembrane glycosyltransferase, partial [Bacteroidales bacterium]|nr:transmembrane glycosyltransferase [Bacteroidales bacterium]
MIYHDNLFLSVVFIIFAFSAAVQLFHYLWFYLAVPLYRYPEEEKTEKKPVSVIICARNEAENLRKFLPS